MPEIAFKMKIDLNISQYEVIQLVLQENDPIIVIDLNKTENIQKNYG